MVMAATVEWFAGQDGTLTVGDRVTGVTYHSTLNSLLVTTKTSDVQVLDVTSGVLLQKSDLSAPSSCEIQCVYLPLCDKVLFCDGDSVCLRKDLSGVLLLDTALQSPVQSTEDVVKIELPLPEANHLYKSLMSAELPGIDFVEDVLKELENEITCALETSKDNHKVLKWATVCLKLPHSALKSVCHNLMMELKRLNQNVPALPVASAITERLNSLVASNQSDNEAGMIDFSLMYSEAARRDTFIDWPHMNYKWALPDPMAQAGFFHQPNATGDDRARCFICNVCLVCWEPTDEPWSEHERHSPTCPFVKGEYTRNVPLSVTHATQLAVSQGYKIECVGTTMSPELVATSSLNGNIVVWNVSRQLKKELQFNLDPSSVFDEQLVVKSSDEAKDDTVDSAIETKAKSDLGEATPVHPPLKTEPVKLTRPSQDVLVSSLCILAETPVDPPSLGTACASPAKPISKRPSLLIGGAIRKNIDSLARDASVTLDSDVETMNEVNQAMSVESVMPIITDEESAIVFGPEMDLASDNPFTPCLLIHSVSRALPAKARQSDGATSKVGQSSSGTKKDMYMTHNMVHADDDVYEDMTYDTVMPGTNKFSTLSMFPPSSIKFMGGGPKETASVNCPPTPGDKIPAVAKVYEEWLDGTILQCVRLPEQLRHPEYCISSITPTYDGKHVIVVVSLRKKSGLILVGRETNVDSGMEMVSSLPCSGCILVYEIKLSETVPLLNEIPVRTCFIDKSEESIRSVFVLPRELGSSQEEDEPLSPKLSEKVELGVLEGQFAVITKAGLIRIYNLATLESLTDVSPADGDTYVSLTYCNGVDRLCAATDMGKLHFLQIGPRGLDFPDGQMASLTSNPTLVSSMESTSAAELRSLSSLGLLVDQRLTTDLLQRLHELTLFENLMPRYSATLPPCWYEIQQEQQQRRHPQHLQQQGELLQHTRTWKLQQDSTSWSEHLLEIALPRPSCIGHIDLKFSLHPLCTDRPHIEVTLLSQNVGKIGRKVSSHQHSNISSNANDAISEDVTDGDNNIASLKEATCTLDVAAAAQQAFYSDVNNVSDPEFLAKHNAEILCGPLDLMSQVDLSSQSGLITLTSPQLLKTMSRSFLIHIKALLTEKEREKETKPKTEKPADKSKSSATSSKVVIKSNSPNTPYLESFYTGAGTKGPSVDQVVSSLPRQKLEDIRGCDWLHEVSVTIRKPRKTSAPTNSNRFQRVAMLDSGEFHRNLVHAVCRHDDLPLVTSLDHRQGLALDILCWITAIQVNEPQTLKSSKPCAAYAVQSELLPLVRSCFIHSGRTVAHKCAKLLVLCIRFMWNSPDKEAAPLFNRSLLQALLVCLPGVLAARSAGAVRWFFTLLNHVKSLDVGRTAEACAGLLSAMSTAYAERMTDLHAVLRTRFGLYGNPCEPSLFDVEPLSRTTSSPTPTPAPSGPITYAQAVGSVPPVSALSAGMGSVQSSSAASSSSQSPADDIDFKDLLSLSSRSSARSSQCNDKLHGLLEVEPLHFVCHATSDGTKMEKLEPGANTTMSSVGSTGMTSSGVMSFINHANLPPAASAAGAALSSLSSAMASAEQQLQQLQLKTTTLMKLQQQKAKLEQKLAESKGAAILSSGSTSLSSTPPGYAWHDTLPPTPKSTPLFMTPPVTPPNESQVLGQPVAAAQTMPSVPEAVDHPLDNSTTMKSSDKSAGKGSLKAPGQPTPKSFYGQASTFLQQPTPHVLVIERMHSGARRFVVLDFGHPILLTDVLIPSCADLASLSIDTWCDGEETDGQRLVIAQDISSRSLVMKDLLPSPMCRYLKITTVGRYGAGTSRSRIPIGSFYGHSFILPWEAGPSTNKPSSSSLALQPDEESRLFSQLGLLMGLQEDIQCRYNLACSRVNALVSSIDLNSTTYEAAPPAQREKSKEDKNILQALNSCAALQLQLNQASRAIERLQGALGIPSEANIGESTNLSVLLRNASSDKLRVLTELLLDILLRITHVTPSIPCVPKSLYLTCDPAFTERLFKSVCIVGTRPMQVSGGMLLLRVCHGQPWWGEFLGNILLDLYSSEQTLVFPKDRVFILLSALGQRSLVSNGGSAMIESLMSHMTSLLTPLQNNQHSYYRQNVTLDLPLVTWMLLFLSRILDNTTSGSYTGNTTDDSSAAKSSKDGNCTGGVGGSTRWDFLQGEGALQELQGLLRSAASSKLYRRKLHKRLLHHKQQLLSLEQAKKKYVAMHKNSKMQEMDLVQKLNDASKKAAEALLSQNGDQVLPKQLKQHSAKHLKDIIQIRRTDGDLLRKLPKDGDDSAASEGEPLPDLCIVLPRDKCLSVIRGLVALVLALDFSCNVDLFLVACKVIAKITTTTRPAISLSEAMTQEQLEKLILLCANVEYNHGNISWGGPWAGHAIVCLLQDILEGEKLYPPTTVNEVTDDETSNFSESEGSQDRESPSAGDDEDQPIIVVENGATAGTNASPGPKKGEKYDKETSLFMDLLLGDAYDNVVTTKLHEYITGEPKSTDVNTNSTSVPDWKSITYNDLSSMTANSMNKPNNSLKEKCEVLLASHRNNGAGPPRVSTALDARLEYGVDCCAELRLKFLASMEAEEVHNALVTALPPSQAKVNDSQSPPTTATVDDSLPVETSGSDTYQTIPSGEMLSLCFDQMFSLLQLHCVNVDTILKLWLALNDDVHDDGNTTGATPGGAVAKFETSRVPSIQLNHSSVTSLLAALAWSPEVSVHTWVLAFQALTLLSRRSGDWPDRWVGHTIINDPNFLTVLLKFMSSLDNSPSGNNQTGPVAVAAFNKFITRFHLRCDSDGAGQFKELLLRLVYKLCAAGGAFSLGQGPLDAQCKLLEHVLEQNFDTIDTTNAISVIEVVTCLVHRFIMIPDRVTCRSSADSRLSARRCFAGILNLSNLSPTTGDASHNQLLCSLLRLVNMLVQVALPGGNQSANQSEPSDGSVDSSSSSSSGQSMTDNIKIHQRPSHVSKSDEEKMSETDEQKTEGAPSRSSSSERHSVKKSRGKKRRCLSDMVLGHEQIMTHLLQALSHCGSVLGSNTALIQDAIGDCDPVTVGDGVFQILSTLNAHASDISLVLRPIMHYLSSGFHGIQSSTICRLSEPLYWLVVHVLDCEEAFDKFLELGAVQIVCQNLVNSSRRVVNSGPSLISTIMQHFGNSNKSTQRKRVGSDSSEELINYAPLGTITSSSPTAGPADILIQSSPPHRRARTAAWSYHFYPEENWIDLTIQLPCPVLLREVHVQPHISSLATSPHSVVVEVSPNSSSPPVPVTAPLPTTGLSNIRLDLNKPEVACVVTIRLQKPRDTSTLGLAQIMLVGSTAFSWTSKGLAGHDDIISGTSVCWLRLLHHFLVHNDTVAAKTALAAASTPNLLKTCTALMLAQSQQGHFSEQAKVALLKMGLHRAEMGLAVIDSLLRNSTFSAEESVPCLYGKTNGAATDATVDLLYALGVHQDEGTEERVRALCDWLGDTARVALQHSGPENEPLPRQSPRTTSFLEGLPNPSPAHVHCVAAVLWHSVQLGTSYSLGSLVTRELLSSLYEWSMTLPHMSALKKSVDAVICSLCHVNPSFFSLVLEWMGIAMQDTVNLDSSLCDDQKDSQRQISHDEHMTDDSKEACQGRTTDLPMPLHDFSLLLLDETHLTTLGMACRSTFATSQLLRCGFPAILAQALVEFCSKEISRLACTSSTVVLEQGQESVGRLGNIRSPRTGKRRASSESVQSQSDKYLCLTADLVAPVLYLLTEAANEPSMKDWLGEPEGHVFWSPLLNMLCNTPVPAQTAPMKIKVMSDSQRAAVEAAAVTFFRQVVASHSTNQLLFAQVLCDVIRGQDGGNHSPLSGFTRRVFLQVLLEDEKVALVFSSTSDLFKDQSTTSHRISLHPRYGAGHNYRVQSLSLQTTCGEVVAKLADKPSFVKESGNGTTTKGETKSLAKDTNEIGLEMVDLLSAAAGYQAKEKRDKDKANKSSALAKKGKTNDMTLLKVNLPVLCVYHHLLQGQALPSKLTLSQLLVMLHNRGIPHGQTIFHVTVAPKSKKRKKDKTPLFVDSEWRDPSVPDLLDDDLPAELLLETPAFQSPLQVFASIGGLSLLAEHLPLLYPEITRQAGPTEGTTDNGPSHPMPDWVTVESAEDIYDDPEDVIIPSSGSQARRSAPAVMPSIPPHSLVAFGLLLRLPGYAEVLLKERRKAQCLLRLVLGVTDDGDGGHILTSPIASSLPALPFHVLRSLLDSAPLTTDDGVLLRRMMLEIGALHLLLACLSVLSHHAPRVPIPGFHQEIILAATQASTTTGGNSTAPSGNATDERGQHYWAKGTGFGTGSTTSSWDAHQALLRQKSEEEHVTCLLQVLASYINPGGHMPKDFESPTYHEVGSEVTALPEVVPELLSQSCLIPSISSYLRNDSVLDMARHVPLYRALLELLRGVAACHSLTHLLLPLDRDAKDTSTSVSGLLEKMKQCVDTYANRLKGGKNGKKPEDEESEGLALLIPDIQETARISHVATERIKKEEEDHLRLEGMERTLGATAENQVSTDEKYMEVMKEEQFDTFEMVSDEDGRVKFLLSHHYESYVKAAGEVGNPARARRLAQEAVTLSTSLPLSASTTLFVRCDEDRLDVMKVLITGPSETPYANGCFEFDVFFPQDYPNSPPLVNLETTGNHTVRFNPNLYNDGKVCLSVLNTWHGRPEEKWNAQTSSFLQVLVSIQSLILVAEPYFNEPGYERSRGTPSGNACSREYDANIRQATVRWAMLEQLRNPSKCFREVIQKHFWLKRQEICTQINGWIAEMESVTSDKRSGRPVSVSTVALKRHFNQLKEELAKMTAPDDLEEFGAYSPDGATAIESSRGKSSGINKDGNTSGAHGGNSKVTWGGTYSQEASSYGNEDDTDSNSLEFKMDLVDQLSKNNNSLSPYVEMVVFDGNDVDNIENDVSLVSTFGSFTGSSDGPPPPDCEDMIVESDTDTGADDDLVTAMATAQQTVDSLSDDAKITADALNGAASAECDVSEVSC